ncbi:MAG: family 78 glycoside hydrolase catalytic domain [Saccharolobus sp.]
MYITDLKVEFTLNPLGIDEQKPRFSWILINNSKRNVSQKAYRVILGTLHSVKNGIGDFWDSDIVESEDNMIEYNGPPLNSFTRYYWRVKLWDNLGESEWSDINWFETAIMNPNDWKGYWITGGQFLRKEFSLDNIINNARVYISGLGYYELFINGVKVGDKALDPPWSDYNKIAYYSTYDITNLLRKGKNAIGIILGKGRFSFERLKHKVKHYGEPRVLAMIRVETSDGKNLIIPTDESWECLEKGPIIDDDIYNGYKYDFRLEPKNWSNPDFNNKWKPCEKVEWLGVKLKSSATIPATKVIDKIKPVSYYNPKPGVYVFDFGRNITGWVRIRVKGGKSGDEIRVRHAELINNDYTLNTKNLVGAEATDVYILRGDDIEILEPKFTYHGFRYAEITGYLPSLEDVEAIVISADLEPIGSFSCSNKLINDIHKITLASLRGNLNNGTQTDCPQRDERMGWLGDIFVSSDSAVYNFNMITYYEKIVDDIIQAQKENGEIPDVAPQYFELYPADPAWGTSLIYLPWLLYTFYGDKRILERSYDAMKKWWEYLYSKTKDGILYFGKYGDWVPPGRISSTENCPLEIISTWILYRDALILSQVSKILGKNDQFSEKAKQILDAFNKHFLRKGPLLGGSYGYYSAYTRPDGTEILLGGSQTCNSLPLFLDMVPKEELNEVLRLLVHLVRTTWDKHLNVGIIGAKYVPEVLVKYGYEDLALDTITQETYPSYGYMIKEGATTLWERWEKLTGDGMNSHNHHMFGSIDAWFYKNIAGVYPLEPGYKRILIKPILFKRINHSSAFIKTIKGYLSVEWKYDQEFSLKLRIPVGSIAEVYLPNGEIWEGEKIVWNKSLTTGLTGLISAKEDGKWIVMEIGSGEYMFRVRNIQQ